LDGLRLRRHRPDDALHDATAAADAHGDDGGREAWFVVAMRRMASSRAL